MGTVRVRKAIVTCLEGKERTTKEILDYINTHTRNGVELKTLAIILVTDPRFKNVGMEIAGPYAKHEITVWALAG